MRCAWLDIPLTARTVHLELVAASLQHLEAELCGPAALGAMLGVAAPPGWPPGDYDYNVLKCFRSQLEVAGDSAAGWFNWYAIAPDANGLRETLVASAGYRGPPAEDGSVEIGYSVMPDARRRGYATELVEFLVARALRFHPVRSVIAQTLESNATSAGVLLRCGFVRVGPGDEPATVRYERSRPSSPNQITGAQ
jgi:[ribosomal protein S5]-alanine N-acetyltransferase